ncbi:hypothetical protein MGS_02547 [Candida albicans P78042]|uniref:Uncharacterized protein n=1 Tax=Candida albicans (strain WO-1) TaxID=294748 RepID=C4YPN6_CANAW|nr:conserved hypothetical protein [Candida albicans WO-1]KHC79415.1 hypothetical protein MGS_02547 [Candida albicans P78042]
MTDTITFLRTCIVTTSSSIEQKDNIKFDVIALLLHHPIVILCRVTIVFAPPAVLFDSLLKPFFPTSIRKCHWKIYTLVHLNSLFQKRYTLTHLIRRSHHTI